MFGKNFWYSFGVTWSSSQKNMLSAASSAQDDNADEIVRRGGSLGL